MMRSTLLLLMPACAIENTIVEVTPAPGATTSDANTPYSMPVGEVLMGLDEGPGGVPTWGVPCGPDTEVELAFRVTTQFASGWSHGTGWCVGWVGFEDDLYIQDYLQTDPSFDPPVSTVQANGGWDDMVCGSPYHCDTLYADHGGVWEQQCSVLALCEDGRARSVGFMW